MAPVPSTRRDSRVEATIPLANPVKGRDGKMIHEITIPNNTAVLICEHHMSPHSLPALKHASALSDTKPEHNRGYLGFRCRSFPVCGSPLDTSAFQLILSINPLYRPERWLSKEQTAGASAVPGVWGNMMTFLGQSHFQPILVLDINLLTALLSSRWSESLHVGASWTSLK